jgi:DNA ligase-1
MTKPFRVMLATDYDVTKLKLPCYASPKLDGIRAYVKDGVVLSRQNKPIPNKFVQAQFKAYEHFDGELIVGEPTDEMCYRKTMSGVMSEDGEPDVTFWVFDHLERLHERYYHRMPTTKKFNLKGRVKALKQVTIHTITQLQQYEAECLELGYEGVIIRDPDAPYKQGRSTVNEGYLLKVKTFLDDECVIVGFEERMANMNEATISETGRAKRSSHKANKVGRGDLGALIVEWKGFQFNIGTGFTDAEREHIWNNRENYHGQLCKFKYFPVGGYDAPRHPVFVGLRSPIDL